MACEKNKKRDDRKRKRTFPLYHRNINKNWYYNRFVAPALALHSQTLNINSKQFLANLYYTYEKVLPNKYDKIHYKNFLNHINSFLTDNSHLINENWVKYLNSQDGKFHIDNIKQLNTVNERVRAGTLLTIAYLRNMDNLNGYLAVKSYKPLNIENFAFKIWSKPWTWLLANILIFDAMDLYAKNTYQYNYKWDHEAIVTHNAIKINTVKWYEIVRPTEEKIFWDALYNIAIPILGEFISSSISSLALLKMSSSFSWLASYLLNFAKSGNFANFFKNVSKASAFLSSFLEKSFIPFLGIQLYVEWPTDGFVQFVTDAIIRYIADWRVREGVIQSPPLVNSEMNKAIKLLRDKTIRGLTSQEKNLLQFLYDNMSNNQKTLFDILEQRFIAYHKASQLRYVLKNDIDFIDKYAPSDYSISINVNIPEFEDAYKNVEQKKMIIKNDNYTVKYLRMYERNDFFNVLKNKKQSDCNYFVTTSLRREITHNKIYFHREDDNLNFSYSSLADNLLFFNNIRRDYFLSLKIAKKCNSIIYNNLANRYKELINYHSGSKTFNGKQIYGSMENFYHMNDIVIFKGCYDPKGQETWYNTEYIDSKTKEEQMSLIKLNELSYNNIVSWNLNEINIITNIRNIKINAFGSFTPNNNLMDVYDYLVTGKHVFYVFPNLLSNVSGYFTYGEFPISEIIDHFLTVFTWQNKTYLKLTLVTKDKRYYYYIPEEYFSIETKTYNRSLPWYTKPKQRKKRSKIICKFLV